MKLAAFDSEVIALKSILDGNENTRIRLLAALRPEFFGNEPTIQIFERIVTLLSSGKEVPRSAIFKDDPILSDKAHMILDGDVPPLKDEDHLTNLVDTLNQYRIIRVIYGGIKDISVRMASESIDVKDIMADLDTMALQARSGDAEHNFLHLGHIENSLQRLKDMYHTPSPPIIPTGFKIFDERTGGFSRGDLVVLSGTTGGGKSVMAMQMAIDMFKNGYSVCFVTLEMTEDEFMNRVFSCYTGLDAKAIKRRGKYLTISMRQQLMKAIDRFDTDGKDRKAQWTVFNPRGEITMAELGLILKPYKYDVIFVDYISLLDIYTEKNQTEASALGNATRIAKINANSQNNVWVVLAQFDEDKQRVRYARAIKEHANFLWGWTYGKEEKDRHLIEVHQQKARNDEIFEFPLRENFSIMRFEDVDASYTPVKPYTAKDNSAMAAALADDDDNDI